MKLQRRGERDERRRSAQAVSPFDVSIRRIEKLGCLSHCGGDGEHILGGTRMKHRSADQNVRPLPQGTIGGGGRLQAQAPAARQALLRCVGIGDPEAGRRPGLMRVMRVAPEEDDLAVGRRPARIVADVGRHLITRVSTSTSQIDEMPPKRSDENAIRRPSRDQSGSRSSNGPLVIAFRPAPSTPIV